MSQPTAVPAGGSVAGLQALVVAAHGRRGMLDLDGKRRAFQVHGRRLRVVCGDQVNVQPAPGGAEPLVVTAVLPRWNTLARQPRRDGEPEILAANVSRLLVVCAPRPVPDLTLLDRYLCAAELMGCEPVVLWNKCDIEPPPEAVLGEYGRLGYRILGVSTRTAAGLDALTALLHDHVGVLVGQSGVGKSSLVNALVPGITAPVGDLSARSGTGTHTTTAVIMYRLAGSGWLVDAPGVRDFVPALLPGAAVADGFVDIRSRAHDCRFADCRHLDEPGCCIKGAVAAGDLSQRRYTSYRELLAADTSRHPGRR
ncbi:MAG: ribosome small subunit-dependent GTPase A [Gammaproteobacteria bacterium]|nr:ribosome small subunit-dependent GTPase A [Gammaproteobacteria bacterium]